MTKELESVWDHVRRKLPWSRKSILTCPYCGWLGWTIESYSRVTHKCGCPYRTSRYCQSHPEVCDVP